MRKALTGEAQAGVKGIPNPLLCAEQSGSHFDGLSGLSRISVVGFVLLLGIYSVCT